MKIINIYMETDELGEHKVIEQSNGIKIKLLRKPSPEYAAKLKERQEKEKIRQQEEQIKLEKERLIKNRMREIAMKELELEGKL